MRPPVRPWAVLLKAGLLFALLNLAAVVIDVPLGKISAYNHLWPGRARLPFGEHPAQSYNLSLFNLDAMFAAHEIAAPDTRDNFRVVLIGDSSVWGTLLRPQETLSGQLNAASFTGCTAPVRVYNLGYPSLSLTKDLLMLERALGYHPDLIIWMTTLESFPKARQLESPIVANNPQAVRALIARYGLSLNPQDPAFADASPFERTIVGNRRALADLWRLQWYGFLWAATGVDQYYPQTYPPAQTDLDPDDTYYDFAPPALDSSRLSLDVLAAGVAAAAPTPVVIVNEPILISDGENSDIRYNFYYPRWAYDDYRAWLSLASHQNGWHYMDMWNIAPPDQFTNSAIHLTAQGTRLVADRLHNVIQSYCP